MDGYKKAQIKHFLPNRALRFEARQYKQTTRQDRSRKILSLTEAISSGPVTKMAVSPFTSILLGLFFFFVAIGTSGVKARILTPIYSPLSSGMNKTCR